ncbi:MAG: DUF4249 family protein [Bacteroidales bacterium]|jgi:hypothetical protein
MKKTIFYIIIIILLSSCEKKVDWLLQNGDTNLIIVDGIITDQDTTQSIKLSFPVTKLNAIPTPVTGATVIVSNEDGSYPMEENPANSGIYQTTNDSVRKPGENYTLSIKYNNKNYTATTTMLPGIYPQTDSIVPDKNDSLYHISTGNNYDAVNYAMYEILIDWSKNHKQLLTPDSSARLLYYTLPTIDESELFPPNTQSVSFPVGTVITIKRYSLTLAYAQYIRALLLETTWQGGLFDTEHANLPTNLSNGAVGFFATCGVRIIQQKVIR